METGRLPHDRRDDSSEVGAGDAAGNGHRTDTDHTLWQQFAEATTPALYYQAWLALQCGMISEVSDGVVVLGVPDRGPFAPAAFWPQTPRDRQHLAEVAERALLERHGLILTQNGSRVPGVPPHPRYHIAYPIQIAGRLHGVVALDNVSSG